MGATFKENVSDIRNSKVADVYHELESYGVQVDVVDPFASSDELIEEYGFGLTDNIVDNYDAVIVAVPHKDYLNKDDNYFRSIMSPDGIFIDLKGKFRDRMANLNYWSL
jgi:UDP-N-acetyl-D-galactosamine dehydrogenase